MNVSLVIRFNLRITMKLTQTQAQTLLTVHWSWFKASKWSSRDCRLVPHTCTKPSNAVHSAFKNICMHKLTHIIHYEPNMKFVFWVVENLPGFIADIGLCIKRWPLFNGKAFDHVVLPSSCHCVFWPLHAIHVLRHDVTSSHSSTLVTWIIKTRRRICLMDGFSDRLNAHS